MCMNICTSIWWNMADETGQDFKWSMIWFESQSGMMDAAMHACPDSNVCHKLAGCWDYCSIILWYYYYYSLLMISLEHLAISTVFEHTNVNMSMINLKIPKKKYILKKFTFLNPKSKIRYILGNFKFWLHIYIHNCSNW